MPRRTPLSNIRNIGIVAHVDAGKTTLTERILFVTGMIHRQGTVDSGNTTTDSHRIERDKGITIASAAVSCPWRGHVLQLIDTPGHVDFSIEVERSLRVLDGAVVVLDGVAGVEPQTESVWRRADRRRLPRLVFVNKLDRPGADFGRCVTELSARLRARPAVIALPLDDASSFVGQLDVIRPRALRWDDEGQLTVTAPSAAERARIDSARRSLVTLLADDDDALLSAAVDGTDVDDATLLQALRQATLAQRVVPVLCGAAFRDKGVEPLLDAVVELLPSPLDRAALDESDVSDGAPLAALAFKVVHDTFGATTLIRVYTGTLTRGDAVLSARSGKRVRVGRIARVFAEKREDVDAAYAGDIVGLVGVSLALGDTLSTSGLALEPVDVPLPVLALAIEPQSRGDRQALATALSRLVAEDPSLVVRTDAETGQTTLSGMGELHLEVALDKLRHDHAVEVVAGRPRVAFKETVTRVVEHAFTWSKQTGGPGQYARVRLRIAPGARGSGLRFLDEVKGGAVPRPFISSVEDGVRDALGRGIVHGHPVVDVEVALVDGAFHAQDSSEIAFRLCAAACFQEAARLAEPRVLEPLMAVEVTVPEDRVGDVVGDLGRRRGLIAAIDARPGERVVRAEVPLAELFGYVGDLRSLTQGRGEATLTPSRLDFAPA